MCISFPDGSLWRLAISPRSKKPQVPKHTVRLRAHLRGRGRCASSESYPGPRSPDVFRRQHCDANLSVAILRTVILPTLRRIVCGEGAVWTVRGNPGFRRVPSEGSDRRQGKHFPLFFCLMQAIVVATTSRWGKKEPQRRWALRFWGERLKLGRSSSVAR